MEREREREREGDCKRSSKAIVEAERVIGH